MEQDKGSVEQAVIQTGKKVWSDPEITILAINAGTLGGVLINDDGVGFSS